MQEENLQELMPQVFTKLAYELLDALEGVALARRALNEAGLTLGSDYAIEEWAHLPEAIAEAVSTLIHCTYDEDVLVSDTWQSWRRKVRQRLQDQLARCGPIRIVK